MAVKNIKSYKVPISDGQTQTELRLTGSPLQKLANKKQSGPYTTLDTYGDTPDGGT
jgi:hypothetical protein